MSLKLLKDRNYLLLMQGSFISQIGTLMQTFALSLYVLANYDSTTLFASILIISAIPRLILGPFAGVLVDWFDRKKIIVRFDILSGLSVLLLAILFSIKGVLPLWSIYTITIVLSLISTLFGPAISTVIPSIMKDDQLLEANSLHNVLMTVASLLSPLLAGVLMSFSEIGIILYVNGISFLISALSESFIEIPMHHKTPEKINIKAFLSDFKEGITLIRNSRFLLTIAMIALVLNFAVSPVFSVGVPHIFKKVMMIRDYEYGLVNSVMGFAALIAGLITGFIGKKYSLKTILAIDLYAQPITVALLTLIASSTFLGFFSTYYIPLILFAILGFVFVIILTIGNISINTSIQKVVPKEMLGRVGTVVSSLCGAAIPLGQALFGMLTDQTTHVLPMTIAAIILLATAVVSVKVIGKTDALPDAA